MDIGCTLGMTILGLGLSAMGYGYKMHVDRKTLKLEKNDLEHQRKHLISEARIKELEKKNGKEQRQMDELKEEVEELKNIIKKCQNEKNNKQQSQKYAKK